MKKTGEDASLFVALHIEEAPVARPLIMDFSLLSPLEFFVDPKNVDGRNN